MALQPANWEGSGLPWRDGSHAAATDTDTTPPPAGRDEMPGRSAASGNVFRHDTVELSRLKRVEAEVTGAVNINRQTGIYEASASVNIERTTETIFTRDEISSLKPRAVTTPDRLESGLWKSTSLRSSLSTSIGSSLGMEMAGKFTASSDWLEGMDPEMYKTYLLLMKMMMEEENHAAAGKLIEGIDSLRHLFSQISDPASAPQADVAELSVARMNIEASVSAISMPVDGGGAGAARAGSFSIRVEGEVVMIRAVGESEAEQGDPLVLDLDGDGIDLKSAEDGVLFDLTGTGRSVQTAFVQGDDALLFLDRNNNGIADNGRELFGDQEGDEHGFAKLKNFDVNRDGEINIKDAVYSQLRLWQDRDGNGESSEEEVLSLAEAGVESISLDYLDSNEEDGQGNTLAQLSHFTRSDGGRGLVADAMLKYYLL